MLDKFTIKYYVLAASPVSRLIRVNNKIYKLMFYYNGINEKDLFDTMSNINKIYYLRWVNQTGFVGLKIVSNSPIILDNYKDICLYNKDGHNISEDIIECFNWIIEKDYVNKITVFE